MPDRIPAFICDMDGTLSLFNGRGPFDYDRCDTDLPNTPIIEIARIMAQHYTLLVVSGREETCRVKTRAWLHQQYVFPHKIFMRPKGDYRKDAVIKQEIFDREIKDLYDIWFVLDDRDQVVNLWRSLGLTCLQVADGKF